MRYFLVFSFFIISFFGVFGNADLSIAAVGDDALLKPNVVDVYFFGRDDCKFCKKEKDFIQSFLKDREDVNIVYYNIKDNSSKELFVSLTESAGIAKVTPITVVGSSIIVGFGSKETSGQDILNAIDANIGKEKLSVEDVINKEKTVGGSSSDGCSDEKNTLCDASSFSAPATTFDAPFFGSVNVKDLSLFSLSFVLGLIDGFNPCALWVLMTFLLILLQIGDKKKMWQVAGLFIAAEAVMYYLILNVWYKTWDFVGLDYIVTPAIGFLALGSGIYFIRKYYKTKDKFTCDVASLEKQASIEGKIAKIANSPMTIAVALGIIGVAFSVNIIEFACSIGIPQAFTKIMEINPISFLERQFYLFIYIFAYMLDDLFLFGLALWGFDKIHLSYKYSKVSTFVGGVLMIILGIILIFFPDILIF